MFLQFCDEVWVVLQRGAANDAGAARVLKLGRMRSPALEMLSSNCMYGWFRVE